MLAETQQEPQIPQEPDKTPIQQILDEILEGLPRWISEPLARNFRQIFAGIAIAFLAVALWSGYTTFMERGENAASARLGSAIQSSDAGTRLELLKKVIKEHGDTDSGRHALLLLGAASIETGDTKGALEYFRQALDTFSKDSPLHDSALMGIGYCEEEMIKPEDAAGKFTNVADHRTGYEAIALLDLARVNTEQGNKKAALEAYDQFMATAPMSSQLDFVRFEIMRLSGSES